MRIFITGISGLLGLNMAVQLRGEHQVSGCYYSHPVKLEGVEALKLDLTRSDETTCALRDIRPDLVIHTAGLTSVEACEDDAELAYRLNVVAARHAGQATATLGARLVHISTDHLFAGTEPWRTEDDAAAPLNVYARTKLQAEDAVLQATPDALIVRTNFFGWGTPVRTSFSDWILESLRARRDLTMFSDVFFTPLLINDLIDLVMVLVSRNARGVLNVAGGERLSKYAFAMTLAWAFGEPTDVIRNISVDAFSFKARRPRDMSLCSARSEVLLGSRMPRVKDGLERLAALEGRGHRDALESAIKVPSPEPGALGVET